MKVIGGSFLSCYRTLNRLQGRCFSFLISGAFASFGKRSALMYPLRVWGEARIAIGDGVFLGPGCWLQTLTDGDNRSVAISIGSGTSVAGSCHISAVRKVVLEENVLLARNVYVSDHIHKYTNTDKPVLAQGVDKVEPVLVKSGAWIGENVVVCPGVTIGKGAVIGANSVVNQDVPDFSVAAGSPARVVKKIALSAP